MAAKPVVGVIGSGGPLAQEQFQLAYDVGMYVAQRGAALVCGGLGGAAGRG